MFRSQLCKRGFSYPEKKVRLQAGIFTRSHFLLSSLAIHTEKSTEVFSFFLPWPHRQESPRLRKTKPQKELDISGDKARNRIFNVSRLSCVGGSHRKKVLR
ncbi:hypothetical protein RRG08_001756 [Elysia crispata]|uniref:Uncharacterized protein n=1 Tax=Elysia crispata TaxID=231223 RepID=A0AAE1AK92_9GAST|nr:hypothetical protein RRG08_001756 [Elysia crispata]